jgi:lipopolysaccharide/colanic/teichoic acid biosynthesis glycosyltransferase
MDVALQYPLVNPVQMVTQPKTQSSTFTKHILRVDRHAHMPEHDYIQEEIYFTNSRIQEAIDNVSKSSGSLDAVMINPEEFTVNITTLIEMARKHAIPLILYTPKFEQAAKDLALRIGLDEYHYGAITYAFLKRIEFIKKLKVYKNQRGDKPYETQGHLEDIPKIKIWGMKRVFDIAVCSTALLALSPLLLVIMVIIKLESKGPIFYISKRAGAGYKIFNFYKFRSMRVGADAELKQLAHLNQYNGDGAENGAAANVFFKIKNDPRITRFGQFLRNTSLDEIPQLFNVLIGDMSLVGNRPLPLYEAEKLTNDQIAWRFLAPAGITGLWQITKRGKDNMSPEERIALDMEYAMKNSFWLDVKIMLSTFPALLQKEKV